jgi:peptidoglycan/LPS O-acetylase OafA/YrhL
MPALDGLRALAVIAVLLYHGDVSWARGGYFGVDAFFVLSGFLITSLLLAEFAADRTIALGAFWARRARRLLPAIALVLVAVAVYAVVVAHPLELRQLRGDGLSTLVYATNWHQVFSHQSYFEQYAAPSALRHTWSLAIEEQFYLVWPLVVLGVLRVTRGSRRALLALCITLATASAALMALWYTPGRDPSRVYYGTDTRAQSLLIGATLAIFFSWRALSPRRARLASLFDATALLAMGALLLLWGTTTSSEAWQYRGGFAVMAILVAFVIANVTQPEHQGLLARGLSWAPLRAVGMISYGLYLWHWPIFVWLSAERTGLDGPRLLAVRLTVTAVVSAASFVFVERPIRRGAFNSVQLRFATPAIAVLLVAGLFVTTATAVPAAYEERTASEVRAPVVSDQSLANAATAVANEPLRVMLVGDSMATSMAPGIRAAATRDGFDFWDASVPGCGLGTDVGDRWFDEWRGVEPRCLPGWRERWPGQLQSYRPDVVIGLFGAQDAFDRRIDGTEIKFDTPDGLSLAQRDMDEAVSVLSSTGADVYMLTTPYYVLGWPQKVQVERSPLFEPWIDNYNNQVVRAVAANHAERVSVLDLNAYLAPDGTWTDTVAGIKVRSFDRCHLSEEGAAYVATWLVPQITGATKS